MPTDDRVKFTKSVNTTGTGPNASVTITMTEEYSRTSNMENIRRDTSHPLRDVSNAPTITTPLTTKFMTSTPVRPALPAPNYRALPAPPQFDDSDEDDNEEDDQSSDDDRAQQQPATRIVRRGKKMPTKRYPPGARALQEIRYLRSTCHCLIQKRPFQRLTREVATKMAGGSQKNWQSSALEALQEAAETFMLRLFEDGNVCMAHRKRKTLMPQDIQLVRRLQDF